MLDQDEINALMAQDDVVEDIESQLTTSLEEEKKEETNKQEKSCQTGSKTWVEKKIEKAHLPYPIEPEHRVVNQLSQVTQDGEEKAGEVFDSISNACEKLAHIDQTLGQLSIQCSNMDKFISVLQSKFSSIEIFSSKSKDIRNMPEEINSLKEDSSVATNDLYKAMETMQYQDISRQKIERVISIVRKLSEYLNNVFDVDAARADIKVANHIHGDKVDEITLANEDDIDNLIKEFGIE